MRRLENENNWNRNCGRHHIGSSSGSRKRAGPVGRCPGFWSWHRGRPDTQLRRLPGRPILGADYGYYVYEPSYAYQSYGYEPEYNYDSYAYVPDDDYVAYSYGPRLRTYAYESVDSYGYAPRVRYSRNYSYSPGVRATRSYSYADTRGVIKGDRGHRSTMVHNTRLQDRAAMRTGFAVGAERESAGSKRIRPQASKALARGPAQDARHSKSIEPGKTGKGRGRTQTY